MKEKLYFLLSMIIFGAVGVFAKYITLPSSKIAFCLSFIGSLALLLVLLWKKKPLNRQQLRKNLSKLIGASFLLSGNWIFLFNAYKETTIANAALSYYLAPVLVILASPLILGERFSWKKALCTAAALLGLFLVLGNGGADIGGNSFLGIAYGFAAAIFYAALTLTNKFIRDLDGLTNTFFQLLFSSGFLAVYILCLDPSWALLPTAQDGMLLLLLGVCHGGLGFYLFFNSMVKIDGQSIAVLSYADPLTSLLISVLLLGNPMTALQYAGTCLLFAAIWIAERRPAAREISASANS